MPEETPFCKKHNKPKTMLKGGRNQWFIGCADCVAEKKSGKPQDTPKPPKTKAGGAATPASAAAPPQEKKTKSFWNW